MKIEYRCSCGRKLYQVPVANPGWHGFKKIPKYIWVCKVCGVKE